MLKLQDTSPQDVWKVLRKKKPAHTKAIPPLAGQDSFEDKCQILRTTIFPLPTPGTDTPDLKPPLQDLRNSSRDITCSEISSSVKHCNRKSAYGYDKIPCLVIEKAHSPQPSLNHPLALIARYLNAGDILENTNIAGPKPPPIFPVTLLPVEDSSNGSKKHQE